MTTYKIDLSVFYYNVTEGWHISDVILARILSLIQYKRFLEIEESNLKNNKPASKKYDVSDRGFNSGYTDTQLETLHKALIDNFLHSKLEYFKNAFSNEVLAEDFEPLKWINPTMGAVFFFHVSHEKPEWTKYKHLFEPANYSKLLSQSRGNGTFENLTEILSKTIL